MGATSLALRPFAGSVPRPALRAVPAALDSESLDVALRDFGLLLGALALARLAAFYDPPLTSSPR